MTPQSSSRARGKKKSVVPARSSVKLRKAPCNSPLASHPMFYFLQTSLDHVKRRRSREALHLSPHPKGYASCPSVTPHHPQVRAPHLGLTRNNISLILMSYVSEEARKLARCESPTSRSGPGESRRANSSVHLGSSSGHSEESPELEPDRPPKRLISFLPPSPPCEG